MVPMRRLFWLFGSPLILVAAVAVSMAALASQAPEGEAAASSGDSVETEKDIANLTGEGIFERVLANRHKSYFQKQRFVSGDAGGGLSQTELWVRWKDNRRKGKARNGAWSKTLAKYTAPNNVRGMGYLIVQKEKPPHDQLVYFPSMRKVRRVNLDESIMGTDFSLEDIVPRELETSVYERLPDRRVDYVDCFVVSLTPKPGSGSQYSKLLVYIEKQHYVPIRTRYWDLDGVVLKEYSTSPNEIEEMEGVWLTMRSNMRDVTTNSFTRLTILEMQPNAKINDSHFTERRLISKSR